MHPTELDAFLQPRLTAAGFALDEVHDSAVYWGASAWAVYCRGADCKMRICWASRDAGTYFMLALPDAPNEHGLVNESKKWRQMLLLSRFRNTVEAPELGADDVTIKSWIAALFDAHFESARARLLAEADTR